jgi:valyl-tRNA synthetase
MRLTMRRMAFSIDWSNEYVTMLPAYYRKTQASFLRMLKNDYIYQSEHPVNFCTRCETAIAFAEVAYEGRTTKLNFFDFDGVEIATTRPELLAACVAVAVHPEDERYASLEGRTLRVPLFGQDVPVVRDEAVDPSFGSGAVMICTFGDKQDVVWWKTHDLALRPAIDATGHMTALAGAFEGLNAAECREAILGEMERTGILKRQVPLEQRVGTCWRCKTPIEILSERQWFVRVDPKAILAAARSLRWVPEHMLLRMEDWVGKMEWDWCISRQRIFATPIPVWFCRDCGEMVLPDPADLPIDPTVDKPSAPCPRCGSSSFEGETDVLDTWMDSSISVMNVTGWDGEAARPPYFPAQIRPQGHDIIRTWAFYTILRSLALTGERPWEEILVNGMVLGEDGFKMSKSRGNIIAPEEILGQYGADALRQWAAAGGATGSDIQFNWNDVIAASRFQTKFWNIARFALLQIGKEEVGEGGAPVALADRWLLARLSALVGETTRAMEDYQFDRALKGIREFAWEVLADEYIELVKGRLYGAGEERAGAVRTLSTTLDILCRVLAPFVPSFAEEVYSYLGRGSVHRQAWPDFVFEDAQALEDGELVARIVAELRRFKHEQGLALNAPLGEVTIMASRAIDDGGDAGRALNAPVRWQVGTGGLTRRIVDVKFDMAVVGKTFRKDAPAFMAAVRALPRESLEKPIASVPVNGVEVAVPEGAFEPVHASLVGGEQVEVVTVGDVLVTVRQSP